MTTASRVRPLRMGLDWLRGGLLVAGLLAVAVGALPASDARATTLRIAPLLLFLGSVIVLAVLAARAELFDVVATRLTILVGGSTAALFLLCLAFAALTTVVLNLDTTAVLLTPVLLATALRAGVPVLPTAMTTVWLANTASLLLPVSNLTNLLAMDRIGLRPLQFAGRMGLPQLAALIAVAVFLWLFYWRHSPPRYTPPEAYRPRDRRLFLAACVACGAFVAGVLVGIAIEFVAAACALGLVVAFARWERTALRWSLLPWRLLVFVTGLFLVVETIGRHGLSTALAHVIGTDPGAPGVVRAALAGGVLANVLNNLPVYVAGEAVVSAGNHDQLLGLLIGTDVGPLVTPWASLATLIWFEACRVMGVKVDMRRFVLTGAATAAVVLAVSVGALLA